jgi:hypothetical protein
VPLTALAHRKVQTPAARASLLAGSGLDSPRIGPALADLARVLFSLENALINLFVLQTLKSHRICSAHAIEVIQISVSSLRQYLSDGIGPMILGAV